MYIARLNHFPKYSNLLSTPYSKTFNQFQPNKCLHRNLIVANNFAVKHYFASKKPSFPKDEKKPQSSKKTVEDSEFLWKINVFFNLTGIAAGFYFPTEALMFMLTSNAILQVYESSKSVNKIVELSQKSLSLKAQELDDATNEIQKNLRKIVITGGFLLVTSIFTGLGIMYPSFGEYALIGLNFWILFNLKFNNFSHGYYIALLSLLLFQYFYFTKVFQSNQRKQSNQSL